MLTWGFHGAFWLLLAVPPVLIFYFLRLRFRKQKVSSIYLWSRLKQPTEGSSRLQQRSLLLLLLQILIILFALAALTRPVWFSKRPGKNGVIILMDVSASMAARDGQKTRWNLAVDWVEERIRQLPLDQEVVVILCAADAKPLGYTGGLERSGLIRQLRNIRPLGVRFNERNVCRHIQAWMTTQGRSWAEWLVTDGGLDMGGQELCNLLGGDLRIQHVGSDIPDIGVYGLRIAVGGNAEFSVKNSGPSPKNVTVQLARNDQPLIQKTIDVPEGIRRYTLTWPNESVEDGLYTIKIMNPRDGFSYDDSAFFAVNPQRNIRVLLVGSDDPFLKAVLRMPGVEVRELTKWPSTEIATRSWDLIVSNGYRIPQKIETNLLYFGEVPMDAPVTTGRRIMGKVTAAQFDHSLIRFVNWENVTLGKGRSLQVDNGVLPLAGVDGQPVLVTWETQGLTRVVFGFSLSDSDLGLSGAFPIFIQNLLQHCVPQLNNPYANTVATGSPVIQTVSEQWKMASKKGVRVWQTRNRVRIEALIPGGYEWRDGQQRGVLAANLPVAELDLTVRTIPAVRNRDYRLNLHAPRQFSLADWLFGCLIICVVLEWMIWRGWKPVGTRGREHGIR